MADHGDTKDMKGQPVGDETLDIADVLTGVGYEYGDDLSQFVDCQPTADGANTTVEVRDMDGGVHYAATLNGAYDLDSLLFEGSIDVL